MSLLAVAALDAGAQSANKTVCKKAPNMPANAVMVFPKSAYTPVQDPSCPPCYEYTTKRGLRVMECPFALFPPEKSASERSAEATSHTEVTRTESNGSGTTVGMESQNSYTGNYNYSRCAKELNLPAGATPVYPKSAYVPSGNPDCPPCYEYTTKRGLKVMECPNLWFTQGK